MAAKIKNYTHLLTNFLINSTTSYNATETIAGVLRENGFTELSETKKWETVKEKSYFVVRDDSTLIAFKTGSKNYKESGFRICGAHTDSPSLRIKAKPENYYNGYLTFGVEPYGGLIMDSWFDRDLSIAGRVSYTDSSNNLQHEIIDFKKPVAFIPNVAFHFNREVNEKRAVNPQKELLPVLLLSQNEKEKTDFFEILKNLMNSSGSKKGRVKAILDFDLFFYDFQPPSIAGLNGDFIVASRLDNLLSCFCGLMGILDSTKEFPSMLCCFNHEEVGSQSFAGASGNFLDSVLKRLVANEEERQITLANSFFISLDNAHAVHPNYPEKSDRNFPVSINKGPVIKINGNLRYATSSKGSGFFQLLCQKADVPFQKFIMRADMKCGSTIGPIISSSLGIETLDIGLPTFSMHSIRETCGVSDSEYLINALKEFYGTKSVRV